MDIEITSLLDLDQFALSHSRAEGGQNAGRETWQASLSQAEETPLLDTPEKLQAMRDFARSSGGWNDEEVSAWDSQEVNALFLQWVAGDCREFPSKHQAYGKGDSRFSTAESLDEVDWRKARKMQEQGQAPSNIYKQGRKVYFTLDQ